jgi:hypothetical protein
VLEFNIIVMGIWVGPENCMLILGKHGIWECKFRVYCNFVAGQCVELIGVHVASVC